MQADNEDPISLWDRTAPADAIAGGMAASADLAIVGAGFTGLSAALHAAEQGLSVQVIEARRIGHGGSGRNVGLVNAGLWLPPDQVRAALGEEAGSRLIAGLGDAPDLVFSLIERHGIACEASRNGTIHVAHSAAGLADLRDRARQWQRLGAPVELLSAAEAARRTGTRARGRGADRGKRPRNEADARGSGLALAQRCGRDQGGFGDPGHQRLQRRPVAGTGAKLHPDPVLSACDGAAGGSGPFDPARR